MKPHTPPWLMTVGTGVAGAGAHVMWSDSAFAGAGLTLVSVGLTAATWFAAKGTGPQRRLHSAITVAAGTSWTTCAAIAGPLEGPLPDLYLMGGAALALSWNIRQMMRTNPDATTSGDSSGLLDAIGLAKLKLGKAKVSDTGQLRVPFELEKGATADELTKALPNLESGLDLRPGAFRVERNPESHRKGVLVGVPVDPLAGATWFPGPSSPGGSITEPLVIGTYDDTMPLLMTLHLGIHYLICGVTGSGKTEAAMDILTEVLTRRDVIVWLSDPVKQGLDLGEMFDACDWVATTQEDTEAMTEALQAAIPVRAAWLRAHSYRTWVAEAAQPQTDPKHSCKPGGACGCPGMPFLLAWMEEAAAALRHMGDDASTGISQEARAVGACIVVSLQRPSHDQIRTSTRASLPSVLSFGLDERDETLALPGEVLDAGAHPGSWGNKFPGYCVLVQAGIDAPRWAASARTFRNDPLVLTWATTAFADVRMGVDPVTAGAAERAAGSTYTDRGQTAPTPVQDA
ncbi:sporulation protein SsgA, partial [Streptomyces sp. SID12501]